MSDPARLARDLRYMRSFGGDLPVVCKSFVVETCEMKRSCNTSQTTQRAVCEWEDKCWSVNCSSWCGRGSINGEAALLAGKQRAFLDRLIDGERTRCVAMGTPCSPVLPPMYIELLQEAPRLHTTAHTYVTLFPTGLCPFSAYLNRGIVIVSRVWISGCLLWSFAGLASMCSVASYHDLNLVLQRTFLYNQLFT